MSIHLGYTLSDDGADGKTSLFEDNSGFDSRNEAITLEFVRKVVPYTLVH
jgi:hypothetical protein